MVFHEDEVVENELALFVRKEIVGRHRRMPERLRVFDELAQDFAVTVFGDVHWHVEFWTDSPAETVDCMAAQAVLFEKFGASLSVFVLCEFRREGRAPVDGVLLKVDLDLLIMIIVNAYMFIFRS